MVLLSVLSVSPQERFVTNTTSRAPSSSPFLVPPEQADSRRGASEVNTSGFRVDIHDPYTRDATMRALTAASKWLGGDGCQLILFEFRDDRGLPLSAKLDELKTTGGVPALDRVSRR